MKKALSEFEKALESFLAPLHKTEIPVNTASDFETSHDLHLLDDLGRSLPEEMVDRVVLLFSKLALFFDRGILLEMVESNQYSPQLIFKDGKLMAIDGVAEKLFCELPTSSTTQVLKLKNSDFLKNIKMDQILSDPKLTTLLIHPVPEFAFILFSKMPDLWLKEHANLTLDKLIKNIQP